MRHRWQVAAFAAALLAAGSIQAQETPGSLAYDGSSWTGYVDGGPSWIVGDLNDFVDDGWGFGFGFGPKVGDRSALLLDFMWSGYSLDQAMLDKAGLPDGNVSLFSLTLNPLWRMNPEGNVGGYLTAGGGYYHRAVEITEPGVAVVPVYDDWYDFGYDPYYDPFLGYTVAPASVVRGRHNDDTVGVNAGLGLSFHPGEFVEIFLEARYHYVWTEKRKTQYVPLVFGIRW